MSNRYHVYYEKSLDQAVEKAWSARRKSRFSRSRLITELLEKFVEETDTILREKEKDSRKLG